MGRQNKQLTSAALFTWLLLCSASPLLAQDYEDQEQQEATQQGNGEQDGPLYDPSVRTSQGQRGQAEEIDRQAQSRYAERLRTASATSVRRFHEVLDDLLAEFGYDVKMGQIKGLKNVAIRKVSVSKAIPKTYEEYAETLVAERIRENSRVRIINCVPCKARTSQLIEGKLLISSPSTNMARLEVAAQQMGIETWMDVILVYHTTHMVLAFNVFDSASKELVWARTYNSETIKTRYQKLAIDYSQVAKARPGEDYVPDYRIMLGFGGGALPNVGGTAKDAAMLALHLRASEKFNNRKSEFGLILGLYNTMSSLLSEYPADKPTASEVEEDPVDEDIEEVVVEAVPKPFSNAITLWGIYGHQFLGPVESYNEVRHGLHVGLGFMLATGYIAPTARLGYDLYFGRSFAVTFGGVFIAPSSVLVDGETLDTNGGGGGEVVLSYNF